jgi:ubiquinone/menaquinone biosynthesis C-methylase UbiE
MEPSEQTQDNSATFHRMSKSAPNTQASPQCSEAERIRAIFTDRKEPGDGLLDLSRLYAHQERQEVLLAFFRQIGLSSLRGLRILDVGCGSGGGLRRLNDFGADPWNCFGIDLLRPALAAGRQVNPNISFVEGRADQLPFASDEFDLVFQFTVFTSVLDGNIRRAIASEIRRVLRPQGYFVWYDFAYSNPKNPHVQGIGRKEIASLLNGFRLQFRKVTLAPPIGRRVARISPILYRMLGTVSLLRTHYFCFAQKP